MNTLKQWIKPYMILSINSKLFNTALELNPHKVFIGNINNLEKSRSFIQKRRMTTTSINNKLNPWFVTGFVDAEGTFGVYLAKNDKRSTGWAVNIRFQLHLHLKDKALLEEIKTFFGGVGTISNHNNKSVYYEVRCLRIRNYYSTFW